MSFLLPYQQEYFLHNGNCIYEKSRQIGISWTAAFKTIVRSCDEQQHTHYVAQDQKSSKRFIEYCVEFLEMLKMPENFYHATAERITFANKSVIDVLTSNPRQLRGRRGVVILDEFAFHDAQEDLLAAAQPVATWAGWIEIISTHNGPFSTFNRLLLDSRAGKNGYRVFRTSIYDAIEKGLVQKINEQSGKNVEEDIFLAELKNNTTNFTFAQEYECKVADEQSYIVQEDTYKKLEKEIGEEIPDVTDVYIGIDVGRNKNWTVLWAIHKTVKNEEIFFDTVAVKVIQNTKLAEQIKIIKEFITPGVVNVNIDKGLFGLSIYEELYDTYGSIINGASINRNLQKELCEKVRKTFDYETISVPRDEKIRADICSMAQVYKNGSISYGGGVGESHADAFYALALALDAADEEEPYVAIGGI